MILIRPLLLALFASVVFPAAARSAEVSIPVGGTWYFAPDPIDRGEQLGWSKPDAGWRGDKPPASNGWDVATVPHDFLSDPRYQLTGVGWYRRSIPVPADATAREWRLQFEQVSQRCRVWLNGEFVGAHEGGYTPFEFVVTAHVRPGRQNLIVVAVDNRVGLHSLPGARTGTGPGAQIFPWLNYGGILGDVTLVGHDRVYIVRQQIEATPNPATGAAAIVARVVVRNATLEPRTLEVSVGIGASLKLTQNDRVGPNAEQTVVLRGELPASLVRLWRVDEHPLYTAHAMVRSGSAEHSADATFGIRAIGVRDGRFLLNDQPIRLAGANRARGHPVWGGRDPDDLVEGDMTLMKAAGLRFARLQHTPPHRNLLDWADRNGMLLVLEVGAWGEPAADLASAELRAQFQAEMRELIALAVNHPSVAAWSVGNEYESWTPAGIAWTHDMAAFVKSIDATRPVTFAAIGTALRKLHDEPSAAGPHAFDEIDFICANTYFPPKELPSYLDPIHVRWPTKPVLITEFGVRADRVKSEDERIANFDQMLAIVRARPWVCGLSYWSFNDYASHYPGTGTDGYRRWGLVDEFRKPRPLYEHIRATVAQGLDAR